MLNTQPPHTRTPHRRTCLHSSPTRFNDRPSRVGGTTPTTAWLKGMLQTRANPVNTAVTIGNDKVQEVFLVELW